MSENRGNKTLADEFIPYRLSWANAPINVKPAGWAGGGGKGHGVGIWLSLLSLWYKESQFYKFTVIVVNEPYTNQLYLQKSTWFLYFDTTVY